MTNSRRNWQGDYFVIKIVSSAHRWTQQQQQQRWLQQQHPKCWFGWSELLMKYTCQSRFCYSGESQFCFRIVFNTPFGNECDNVWRDTEIARWNLFIYSDFSLFPFRILEITWYLTQDCSETIWYLTRYCSELHSKLCNILHKIIRHLPEKMIKNVLFYDKRVVLGLGFFIENTIHRKWFLLNST